MPKITEKTIFVFIYILISGKLYFHSFIRRHRFGLGEVQTGCHDIMQLAGVWVYAGNTLEQEPWYSGRINDCQRVFSGNCRHR